MNEWVWSYGGMILTGENWSTVRGTLYSVCGRWMNEYGAMVEWYWQGKTEVLLEKHYTVCVVDEWMSVEQWWNDTDRGNWSTGRKTCHNATFSTTNLTRTGLGSNTGLIGDRLATKRLNQCTVYKHNGQPELCLNIQFAPRSKHSEIQNPGS
jgi:hypothetical protein